MSSSFLEADAGLVERIVQLLQDLGLTCEQGRNVAVIPDDVLTLIDRCDVFVCILTPGERDRISESVTFEIGAAHHAKKDILIFRDPKVPVQGFYQHRVQIPFDRKAVEGGDPVELRRLQQAAQETLGWYGFDVHFDPELDKRFEFAKTKAHMLGSEVIGFYHDALYVNEVRDRAVKNFPTKADRRANRMAKMAIEAEQLTQADGVISEEEENKVERIREILDEKEFVWIVDPLDGTLNFAYGFPFFCVSLGLLRNGEPVAGVIYNPTTQELYGGCKGRGSEVIDLKSGARQPIQLRSTKTSLGDCIVMTHLSSSRDPRKITIDLLNDLMERCRSVRMLGSGQMALVSLALGQFDLFFNYRTHIWDIVPGFVILKGAGGFVSSSLGSETWDSRSRGIVAAANAEIGSQLQEFLRERIPGALPSY